MPASTAATDYVLRDAHHFKIQRIQCKKIIFLILYTKLRQWIFNTFSSYTAIENADAERIYELKNYSYLRLNEFQDTKSYSPARSEYAKEKSEEEKNEKTEKKEWFEELQ